MMRALLVLRPREPAIFTERAATEGVHRSRLYPPGSALLGWAAQRYGDFEKRGTAFDVFHSGKVRFSDALPTMADRVAYPMPKVLLAQKGGKQVIGDTRTRVLERDAVWVGRKAYRADNEEPDGTLRFQPDVVKLPLVTLPLHVPEVATGGRLRTSTEKGRAKDGALFGYTHIEPVRWDRDLEGQRDLTEPRETVFIAKVEADDSLPIKDWQILRETFDGHTLRLGRAAATGYGGWYECTWDDTTEVDPWRPHVLAGPARDRAEPDLIRVWALSDLALLDEQGMPTMMPPANVFGLAGCELDPGECVVTPRRYAPWNRKIDARDVERIVIAAGSVLSYRFKNGLQKDPDGFRTVGLWQEQGLGHVWIDPPMLRQGRLVAEKAQAVPGLNHPDARNAEFVAPTEGIGGWAADMAAALDEGERDRLYKSWSRDLAKALGGGDGPSPSQWHRAANAARKARDGAAILEALFDGNAPACGQEQAGTRRGDWHLEMRVGGTSLRTWLRGQIKAEVDKNTPPARIAWALDQLAREAGRRKRAERDKETV